MIDEVINNEIYWVSLMISVVRGKRWLVGVFLEPQSEGCPKDDDGKSKPKRRRCCEWVTCVWQSKMVARTAITKQIVTSCTKHLAFQKTQYVQHDHQRTASSPPNPQSQQDTFHFGSPKLTKKKQLFLTYELNLLNSEELLGIENYITGAEKVMKRIAAHLPNLLLLLPTGR